MEEIDLNMTFGTVKNYAPQETTNKKFITINLNRNLSKNYTS